MDDISRDISPTNWTFPIMPWVWNGKNLADSLVGARPVEVINIFVENALKMAFIDYFDKNSYWKNSDGIFAPYNVVWKNRKAFTADLKTIYKAATREEYEANLLKLEETWRQWISPGNGLPRSKIGSWSSTSWLSVLMTGVRCDLPLHTYTQCSWHYFFMFSWSF